MISENGREISGGEEQKIALAKALYKNTPMLVLDEPTVFDNGSIVQKGSHKKLSEEKDGKYYELWNAQAKYYQMQAGERENL